MRSPPKAPGALRAQPTRPEFNKALDIPARDRRCNAAGNHQPDVEGEGSLAFISNHHVGPDMEIELFLLNPERRATVESPADLI